MELIIQNDFGINPNIGTKGSAGIDFYMPDITTYEQMLAAFQAFMNTYTLTDNELRNVFKELKTSYNNHFIIPIKGIDVNKFWERHKYNIVHLFLAVSTPSFSVYRNLDDLTDSFVEHKLVYDRTLDKIGVQMWSMDHICINSGIKVMLPENTVGIFFNRSGRGKAGFDVRAQVIDSDYSGYVHLNLAMTKEYYNMQDKACHIYAGDKLTQMIILPYIKPDMYTVSADDFEKLWSARGTDRGDGAFGSTDKK